MARFTKFNLRSGSRVRVDLDKVLYVVEVGKGTDITLDNGEELGVQEGFQTVSNRLASSTESAEPAQA